jgi:hypothetical protein
MEQVWLACIWIPVPLDLFDGEGAIDLQLAGPGNPGASLQERAPEAAVALRVF